jgi:hypothetical protein
MEVNNFDRDIREKLETREILPSARSWDRLEGMLTVVDKPKHPSYWMYIAASFVGLLFIGTIYFNGVETGVINKGNPIVQEQKIDKKYLEKPEIINKKVLPSQIQRKSSNENRGVVTNDNLKKDPKHLVNKNKEILLFNQSKENNSTVNYTEEKRCQSLSRTKYISAEKLLAEISYTNLEAEAADRTIEKTRKISAVDPSSLLSNAETELDQSFKESALQKLDKKFNAIKIAVASRNYEE